MKTEFYFSVKRNLDKFFISFYSLFFLWFLVFIKLKNPEEIIAFDYILVLSLILSSFYPFYPSKLKNITLLFLLLFFNPLLDNIFSSFPFVYKSLIYITIFVFLIKSNLKSKATYVLLFNVLFLSIIYAYNCINSNEIIVKEKRNIIELTAITEIENQHNVDIVIIDAYPDFQILRDSFHYNSKLEKLLTDKSFQIQKPNIFSTRTPYSIANLVYGKNLNDSFVLNYNFRKPYLKIIIEDSKLIQSAKKNNYNFSNNTLLNYKFDNTIWRTYWPDFDYFYLGLLNKFPTFMERCKSILNFGITEDLYSNSMVSNIELIDKYNSKVLKSAGKIQNSNAKYLNIYHLLTLHKYNPQNPRDAFNTDIVDADSMGCEIIKNILRNHNSTLIVCSDHGNRTVIKNEENQKKGILAIKTLPNHNP